MEDIDNLIIARLGEHNRKTDFIQRNLRTQSFRHFSLRKTVYIGMSIAACLVIFAVSTFIFKGNSLSDISMETPTFNQFRNGGSNNITSLIEQGEYTKALPIVEFKITETDEEIAHIKSVELSPEEEDYLLDLYLEEKEELLWSKIYLLVKLEKKDELKISCREYLSNKNFKSHVGSINKILEKI